MDYIDKERVNIHYEIPLSEIVYDFFDKLKSYTKGYASFDYDIIGYKESNLVKMDIMLNLLNITATKSFSVLCEVYAPVYSDVYSKLCEFLECYVS